MALLSQYDFNPGKGTVSPDSSGNGLDLTASNAVTSWAVGRTGSAATTQHTGLFGPNVAQTNWTMMGWVRRTGTWVGFAAAFGKDQCYVEANSAASYEIDFFGGTNNSGVGAGALLVLDKWTHIAVTRSSTDGFTRLYVNGTLTGAAVANPAQNFGTGTWGVALTAATAVEDATFAGSVEEFRTFDTTLSVAEINGLAGIPLGVGDPPLQNLLAQYPYTTAAMPWGERPFQPPIPMQVWVSPPDGPAAPPANDLDSPLLGAYGDASVYWQIYNSFSNARSRAYQEVSQRRRDADPGSLGQSQLENELLGGATTGLRTNVAATHADRREVPQYTLRESPAGLLDDALLVEVPPPLAVPVAATYQRAPWLRISQVRADQSSQATPDTDLTQGGYGPEWRRWRRDLITLQPRQLESVPGMLDTALLENELLGGAATESRTNLPATHADRREVPQQPLRESSYGLLDQAQLEVPPPLPWWYAAATYLRTQWLRIKQQQYDQSVAAGAADSDPTQAGYGSEWRRWRRDPASLRQRELESAYGLLDQAQLEVPPPLSIAYGLAATQQRLPWLRIKQQQYDQSVAAIITDFDPTQAGGYGPSWRWWYRSPVAPAQRDRKSDPNLLLTALLENELLGGIDDLARHRRWSARPWFGLQRAAVIDQSSVSTFFDSTQAGYGPRWMWYRAPVAPVQRERESDPGLLSMALLEDSLQTGYGPRWMWYRPPVAPVQRDRESDPLLLLSALLEDALLGGWDDILRHRTWHTDRREVPQQRNYPAALQPLADPLLVVGAEWRYRLIPITHRARWVLRQWWQQQTFPGAPLQIFQGTIVGGRMSANSVTGGQYSISGVLGGQFSTELGEVYGNHGYGDDIYPGGWPPDITGGSRVGAMFGIARGTRSGGGPYGAGSYGAGQYSVELTPGVVGGRQ